MEIDQPSQENPDQETLDEQETGHVVRSYECTFCRRGFSNAQALGGHMIIHRKDKAKFKNDNSSHVIHQQSLDIPHNNISSSFSPFRLEGNFRDADRSWIRKWPWILDRKDGGETHVGVHQLPLFADKPSNKNQEKGGIQALDHIIDKGLSSLSSSHDLLSSDLDLELRLGPDPHDTSPTTTSTKKFF